MFKSHNEILMPKERFSVRFEKIDVFAVINAISKHKEAQFLIEDNDVFFCEEVYAALLNNTTIKELRLRNNILQRQLKALCVLMDDNKAIVKIQIANKVFPGVGGAYPEIQFLSAALTLNQQMRDDAYNVMLDPASHEIIIDDSRKLLFEKFLTTIIAHPSVTKITIKESVTLQQLHCLNIILKRNMHIKAVFINNCNAAVEEVEKKPNYFIGYNNDNKPTFESESRVLRNLITFNSCLSELYKGESDSLILNRYLSAEQCDAVVECLKAGNLVRVLEVSELNETLCDAIPVDGSLTELRVACRLRDESNAHQRKLLKKFIARNISVHTIIHYDSYNNLTENISESYYGLEYVVNQLKVNNYYHALQNQNPISVEFNQMQISDDKARLIARRLDCTKIQKLNIDRCNISEVGLFELFTAFADNRVGSLKSLTVQNVELSARNFSIIMRIVQQNPFLTVLQLISARISDNEIRSLAESLKANIQLATLNLSGNAIGNQGITELCGALETNIRIGTLSISGNPFDSTGIAAVRLLLEKNFYIARLYIEKSCLKEADIKPFVDALSKTNFSLIELRLSHHTDANRHFAHGFNAPPTIAAYKKPSMDRIEKFVTRNKGKRDELFINVRQGKVEAVTKLFSSNVSPHCVDQEGNTPLHVSLMQKPPCIPLVQCLVRKHSHLLVRNLAGQTPIEVLPEDTTLELRQLLQAAQQNFIARKELLPAEEPQQKKAKKSGPLDQFFVAKKSVPKPAENNDASNSYTAYFAALNNDVQLLRKLDHTCIFADGNTLWHLVASRNALDSLHVLYGNKQLACIANRVGQLPLHVACLNTNSEVSIEILHMIFDANLEAINALDFFGLSPLACLTGGFDLQNVRLELDNYRAIAAKYLLDRGADPNQVFEELNTGRKRCSVLQRSVALGYYRLAKVLLTSPRCDLSHVDSEGWSVLHYAVYYGRVDLLARLLIQPQVNLDILNRSGKTARQMLLENQFSIIVVDQQTIKDQMNVIFDARLRNRLPTAASELHWVKNFEIYFGCRFSRKHDMTLSFNAEHAELQSAARPHLHKPGNFLSASLTFIMTKGAHSPGAHLPRVTVKICLNTVESFHASDAWEAVKMKRSPDACDRIVSRFEAAPADVKVNAVDNVNQDKKPLTPQGVRTLFATRDAEIEYNFEMRFHHSEHALFDQLQQPHTIRSIIERLQADPNYMHGAKIYAVILNSFSKNYVCCDCAVSTMGFQNTREGQFFQLLKAQLASIGCALPKMSDLRTITLFSAQQPFRQPRKGAEDHVDLAIDLRAHQNNLILSKDIVVNAPQATMFTSRKNY